MSLVQPSSSPFYSPSGCISRGAYIGRVLFFAAVCVTISATSTGKSLVAGAIFMVALLLILMQAIKRGRDAGWHWLNTILLVVVLNGITLAALAVWPSKKSKGEPLDQAAAA